MDTTVIVLVAVLAVIGAGFGVLNNILNYTNNKEQIRLLKEQKAHLEQQDQTAEETKQVAQSINITVDGRMSDMQARLDALTKDMAIIHDASKVVVVKKDSVEVAAALATITAMSAAPDPASVAPAPPVPIPTPEKEPTP